MNSKYGEHYLIGGAKALGEREVPLVIQMSPNATKILQTFKDLQDEAWEKEPLSRLSEAGQVVAFKHEGFWQSMDTARDKDYLNSLWQSGDRPWITWN